MFDRLGEMFHFANAGSIVLVVIVLAAIIGVAFFIARSRMKREKATSAAKAKKVEAVQKAREKLSKEPVITEAESGEIKLYGVGEINALVFTKDGSHIDFTTIPMPIGNINQFQPNLAFSGAGCIVKENENGEIVDWDTSNIEYKPEESPERAWFAIHPNPQTKRFWTVPIAWWKSVSMWFAAGMLLIVFIAFLAVFGG